MALSRDSSGLRFQAERAAPWWGWGRRGLQPALLCPAEGGKSPVTGIMCLSIRFVHMQWDLSFTRDNGRITTDLMYSSPKRFNENRAPGPKLLPQNVRQLPRTVKAEGHESLFISHTALRNPPPLSRPQTEGVQSTLNLGETHGEPVACTDTTLLPTWVQKHLPCCSLPSWQAPSIHLCTRHGLMAGGRQLPWHVERTPLLKCLASKKYARNDSAEKVSLTSYLGT